MAAMLLRSALARLVLRRSPASLRLLSCLPAVSFSDNTTAGRTGRRCAEEGNKESPRRKDKKARTKPKARSTSSRVHGDLDDLYMTTQLFHDVDSCRHAISRRQGGHKPASSAAVPQDHRDEHEPVVLRGSSTGPADSPTTRDLLPTTGCSSPAAKSSSPPGNSSCSGSSLDLWGSGDSSYSGGGADFSGDFFDFFD